MVSWVGIHVKVSSEVIMRKMRLFTWIFWSGLRVEVSFKVIKENEANYADELGRHACKGKYEENEASYVENMCRQACKGEL